MPMRVAFEGLENMPQVERMESDLFEAFEVTAAEWAYVSLEAWPIVLSFPTRSIRNLTGFLHS